MIWIGGVALAFGVVTNVMRARDGSVGGSLLWVGLGVLPIYLVGVWLARRRPDHPQTRRLLLLGAASAVAVCIENVASMAYQGPQSDGWLAWVSLVGQLNGVVMTVAAVQLFATYPDGVVEHRWQRFVVTGLWWLLAVPFLQQMANPTLVLDRYIAGRLENPPTDLASPLFVPVLAPLAPVVNFLADPIVAGIAATFLLLFRFATATREQRRRMRMLTYTLLAAVPLLVASLILRTLGFDEYSTVLSILEALYLPILLAIPLSIVVGVLRYRLYEIDVIVRRSVVYGVLTWCIAFVYIVLAAAPGLALGDQIPVQVAVVLTILAALAFQPLRKRLEALADRWVFGAAVNRYQLLTDFGASLEHTLAVPDLLPRLADTVRRGLGAPWVRVSLPGVEESCSGDATGSPGLTVPLEDRGSPAATGPGSAARPETVGLIECGPKPDGYDLQDRELLTTLAGQAATAIANVRLSAALADRLAELDRSRARLVTAADAERRRIERDIHDGVQQEVVALMMNLRLARNQVSRGERSADDAFDALAGEVRDLLADLRELAHGIHPPVLSDGGLVAAVEARTARLPFDVRVVARPDVRAARFGDDVEGAAYFVVCEALTNVAKHAGSAHTEIALTARDGELSVVVSDRGAGFVMNGRSGAGLTNLRDRVEALGGRLRIDTEPGRGTSVVARLPVPVGGSDSRSASGSNGGRDDDA